MRRLRDSAAERRIDGANIGIFQWGTGGSRQDDCNILRGYGVSVKFWEVSQLGGGPFDCSKYRHPASADTHEATATAGSENQKLSQIAL